MHLGVSHGRKQNELQRRARQAFREDERAHLSEHRLLDEEQRHADMVAKTTRLRELRLAREAAWREAAQVAAKAKPAKQAKDEGAERERWAGRG